MGDNPDRGEFAMLMAGELSAFGIGDPINVDEHNFALNWLDRSFLDHRPST